jgi:hypothetical protein
MGYSQARILRYAQDDRHMRAAPAEEKSPPTEIEKRCWDMANLFMAEGVHGVDAACS